jgi:hypothetical protein
MRNFVRNLKFVVYRPVFYVAIGFCALVAGIISYFSGMSFWVMLPIVLGAMYINALLLDFEDKTPGGFLNPTKEQMGSRKHQ